MRAFFFATSIMLLAGAASAHETHHRRVVSGLHFDMSRLTFQYASNTDGLSSFVQTSPEVGFNSSTTRNGPGRSGIVSTRSTMVHFGQGDALSSVDQAYAYSSGTLGHHWLSWPGVSVGGSDTVARVPRAYLNTIERNTKDSGHSDVAAIGKVSNYVLSGGRNVEAPRGHDLVQSKGSTPLDFGYQVAGRVDRGIDTTRMISGANASVVLAEGQRVYFDARPVPGENDFTNIQDTDLGGTYITFLNGSFRFYINGNLTHEIR